MPKLFWANLIYVRFPSKKAKVVTSFSMRYEFEGPIRMFAVLASSENYTWLVIRENNYLAAAFMIGILLICWVRRHSDRWLAYFGCFAVVLENSFMIVVVGLVFIFLRPVTQFIYFQF